MAVGVAPLPNHLLAVAGQQLPRTHTDSTSMVVVVFANSETVAFRAAVLSCHYDDANGKPINSAAEFALAARAHKSLWNILVRVACLRKRRSGRQNGQGFTDKWGDLRIYP